MRPMLVPLLHRCAAAGVLVLGSWSCAAPALFGVQAWPPAEPPVDAARPGPGAALASGAGGRVPARDGSAGSAERPLLGWDGAPVSAPATENVVRDDDHTHVLAPEPTGRLHIIELYQQVLDERDSLAQEVASLNAMLAKTEALLGSSGGDVSRLESKIVELDDENERLRQENADLSARLTTAQIRRLEAEKLLLETRIQWHRARRPESSAAESAKAVRAGTSAGSPGGGPR